MPEPLYRVTFNADALLREHPPRLRDSHKAALFAIAYAPGETPAGVVEVTRWPKRIEQPLSLGSLEREVRPDFYDYSPLAASGTVLEWHVNFADPILFVAYGSGLFAQDEMQVAEHPLLGSVREALRKRGVSAKTEDETGGTPILVSNVERRIAVATNPDAAAGRPAGLYGNQFASASLDAIRRATRKIEPATQSNIIAMAAPACGRGDYTESQIESVFTTALTAFAAARQESIRLRGATCQAVVHSGFWGCGAFGGNRKLMIALQALAARAANITRLVIHAGDTSGLEAARIGLDVADSVASRCGSPCSLDTLVGRCAILGYQWGVSDGN